MCPAKQKTFTPRQTANEGKGSFSDPAGKQARGAGLILLFDGEVDPRRRANHDERISSRYPDLEPDLTPAFPVFQPVALAVKRNALRGRNLYLLTVAQPSRNLTGFPDAGLRRCPASHGTLSKSALFVRRAPQIAKKKFRAARVSGARPSGDGGEDSSVEPGRHRSRRRIGTRGRSTPIADRREERGSSWDVDRNGGSTGTPRSRHQDAVSKARHRTFRTERRAPWLRELVCTRRSRSGAGHFPRPVGHDPVAGPEPGFSAVQHAATPREFVKASSGYQSNRS